jgi:hypothetical protein
MFFALPVRRVSPRDVAAGKLLVTMNFSHLFPLIIGNSSVFFQAIETDSHLAHLQCQGCQQGLTQDRLTPLTLLLVLSQCMLQSKAPATPIPAVDGSILYGPLRDAWMVECAKKSTQRKPSLVPTPVGHRMTAPQVEATARAADDALFSLHTDRRLLEHMLPSVEPQRASFTAPTLSQLTAPSMDGTPRTTPREKRRRGF